MTTDQRTRDLRLLGLGAEATDADVLAACHRRRALYEPDNLAIYSLLDEEARQQLLVEFEAAMHRLTASSRPSQAVLKSSQPINVDWLPDLPAGPEPDQNSSPGAFLRFRRLARGISLGDVARDTKIAEARLEAIESESPDRLPAPVYVRGFVVNFARLLDLPDPDGLARAYLDKIQSISEMGNQG